MKKLFTLIALLAMFMGVNAKVFIDSKVNFAETTEYKDYLWGNEEAKARITVSDGCLHFHSEEATANNWDCQYSPLPGVTDMEQGVTYTVKIKVKGTPDGSLCMHLAGTDRYPALDFTGDWQEFTIDYFCEDPKGTYGSNDRLTIQSGSFVGDYWIEYIEISHEGKEEKPAEWDPILDFNKEAGTFETTCPVQRIYKSVEKEKDIISSEEILSMVENSPVAKVDGEWVFTNKSEAIDINEYTTNKKGEDISGNYGWANQLFICFPKKLKAGDIIKVSFDYKSDVPANTITQAHGLATQYHFYQCLGDVKFTTEWQSFEKQVTITSDMAGSDGMYSIAFNLNPESQVANNFYLKNVYVGKMKLEEGYFVTATNPELGIEYDYENATKFEFDEEEEAYFATVGKKGDKESWVTEIMLSTVRGNDKAYKSNTIKCNVKNEEWISYSASSNAKIKLPAAGVYKIGIDDKDNMMYVEQIEGEEIKVVEPIEVNPNPTEVILNGKEREELGSDDDPESPSGRAWDNQFGITANRPLAAGETTIVKFTYWADQEANTNTQCCNANTGGYMHWDCIGDVLFQTEEQQFEKLFTIPEAADGMQNITFNMAVIKEANNYHIKDIIWAVVNEDGETVETLINEEGTSNFFVKEGAGTTPREFGTDPTGIKDIETVAKNAKAVKAIVDGQLVIVTPNGKVTVTGAKLK